MKKILLFFVLISNFVFAQEDCSAAIQTCGNSTISYTPSGIGNTNETLGGCLTDGEHNSVWYKFTVATSGTLTFTIVPQGNVDYDWAVYGPDKTCSSRGAPIRCNYAAPSGGNYNTGLNMTSTILSAGAFGNPFCRYLDVIAGQTYFLYVDNYTNPNTQFGLTWGGSATLQDPYTDAVNAANPILEPGNPGPTANSPREIYICSNLTSFNFTSLTPGILNGNSNFSVTYHSTANGALLGTGALNSPYTVNTTSTYYYSIKYNDPTNPGGSSACRKIGSFKFVNISEPVSLSTTSNTICPNGTGTVTITSNRPTGNTWSTGATTQSITVSSAGSYSVSYFNGTCTSTAQTTITNAPVPTIQINGNLNFCEGLSTTLTASSNINGVTYSWSNGTTGASTNINTAGTYTVTASIPNGCSSTQTVTVVQNPKPTVQNASLTTCSLTSTGNFDLTSAQSQISTASGLTFTYYQNQADAVAGNNSFITTTTNYNSGNGIVYVLVKDANCSNIAQLNLNVTQSAASVITASSTVLCPNNTITLSSNFASGNSWSNGATTQSITVSTAGTYTLTNTSNGCTGAPASIVITSEANPNLQITGNLNFCDGGSTTLTATTSGTGITYSWSNGATTPTINVTTEGSYSVTATTSNGCIYTSTVNVVKNPKPTVQNASLTTCSLTSTGNFDLTSAQSQISTASGLTFTYYQNQADAIAGNNSFITTTTNYNSGNGIVYVLVKDANCSNIAQLNLNITQSAASVITASSTVLCPNNTITLSSNFASGNSWSNGATTQSITVSTAGTYTLTNTSNGCTGAPASIVITSEANPNLQITGNLNFCDGGSTTLTATTSGTGITYSWSNGATTPTINVTTEGNYTVTATTANGCIYTSTVNVVKNPVPTVQNSSLTVCSLNTTSAFDLTSAQNQISTTSGVTFNFYQNQADAIAGNNNFIQSPTSFTSGNATIYVNVQLGTCSKVAELQLNVTPTPTPTITQSAPAVCGSTPVTLTSSLPTGNLWSTGATTQSITVTSAGNYTLTNTNNGCTSAVVSASVGYSADPNLQITGNLMFCDGASNNLTATATGTGHTYLWNTGATTSSINVTTSGTYTVTLTTTQGCQFSKSVTVQSDPAINIVIATPAQITCSTTQVTLNASASTFQAGSSIAWTATGGGVIVNGANTLTPTVSSAGTYTLKITNNTTLACSKQLSVTVTQDKTPPTVVLQAPRLTICQGDSVTITASGAATYNWNGLSGNGNTQTVSPTSTTTYSVSGVGANGCNSTGATNITITVIPDITVPLLKDVQICPSERTTLNATAGPNHSYLWSTGETTPTIVTSTPGTYTVTVTNIGCSRTFTVVVSYFHLPEVKEIKYQDGTLIIDATNFGNTPLEYSIDGGITWHPNNSFPNVIRNNNYVIKVRNRGMHCDTEVEFYTHFIPNSITPNGDGINDKIDFTNIAKQNQFSGEIINKYGQTVYKLSPGNTIWNAQYLGKPLPTDTYWYKLSWVDKISGKPIQLTGWILVKNRN